MLCFNAVPKAWWRRNQNADMNTDTLSEVIVRPDMRYCFRSVRFRPNTRTKHISVPPRHMTKSYIPDFNIISQHYRYKDKTCHTIGKQLPEYNITAEDTCLSTDYNQVPNAKVKHTMPMYTRFQALCRGHLASRRRVFARRPEEGSSSSTEVQGRCITCEKREERDELYQQSDNQILTVR